MTTLAVSVTGIARRIGELDRVWLALGFAFLFGLVIAPRLAGETLWFVGQSLLSVAPFLALAVATAAGAKASGAENLIARAFKGHGLQAIAIAAIFGGLSPFCSCGVIPVIAALLAMGVPLPAVMAFWLASPIMDPEIYFLTAGPLGFTFATGKALAAIGIGLFGGLATWGLMRIGGFANPLRADFQSCNGGCGAPNIGDDGAIRWRFWQDSARRTLFWRQSLDTSLFLGKWLALAFALESLMLAYVPADAVAEFLGGDSALVIPLAALVGMPAYLNSYAAIPLMSGLIDLGMQPGAAMAFMTAGAVSSIPAAIAVFALVRFRVFLWYLGLAVVGSVLVGYAYQVAVA